MIDGDIKGGHGISFRAQQSNLNFEILLKVKIYQGLAKFSNKNSNKS